MIRLFKSLNQKIKLMVSKAIITAVKDSGKIQLVQIDLGNNEIIDGVERIQEFGFTSHPTNESEAIVICIAGNREHPIVISTDSGGNRPELNKGDSALYNSAGSKILLQGNTIKIIGNAIELGSTVQKLINESFVALYNAHVHSGVTTGVGYSGPPAALPGTVLTSKTKAE